MPRWMVLGILLLSASARAAASIIPRSGASAGAAFGREYFRLRPPYLLNGVRPGALTQFQYTHGLHPSQIDWASSPAPLPPRERSSEAVCCITRR